MSGEFDIIQRYFATSNTVITDNVKFAIGDDCAITNLPPTQSLAITTDTLVENIHFFADISPQDLAYKTLAVNFSDLAAMGAKPTWVSLALTLPHIDHHWLQSFSQAFFQTLADYQVTLIGGDTTKGSLCLTVTAHGVVEKGKALYRHGAKVGDWIYVSGHLGDSAAGLKLLQQQQKNPNTKSAVTFEQEFLIQRHLRPSPRVELGLALTDIANSAIDISDGLVGDLGHILRASQCRAEIELTQLPLSVPLIQQMGQQQAQQLALTGGEDYELCFTVSPEQRQYLHQLSAQINVPLHCIGQIQAGQPNIVYKQNGEVVDLPLTTSSFDHFK